MDPGFFARFGLYVAPDFLAEETCRRVREAMEAAQQVEATVENEGELEVDRSHRKTRVAKVDPETSMLVREHLNALRETLAGHFGLDLDECEKPQFLVYEEGDFFRPHMDSSDKNADEASGRRVSAVVFLNEASAEPAPGAYGGGSLSFYGLLQDDPKGQGVGLPLVATPGALVAFPSQLVHGVTPVTHGRRYTIASWFPTGTVDNV
jgi:predicted 2-oxoglutarate/Fe(II)-dependent dioxygenase YbiX